MKMKLLLAGLVVILLNTGSSCINDSILVAVNLPMSSTWSIGGGNQATFGGTATIKLADQIDASYIDNIQAVRYYDIKVSVSGAYDGNVSGSAMISKGDGPLDSLLTFSGPWTKFQTSQSLLVPTQYIRFKQAGLAVLLSALTEFKTNNATTVHLKGSGSVDKIPVPGGLTVTVEILSQVDAQVRSGDSTN